MDEFAAIETIANVIQLAVAPVFLLAGIAGFLNVLSIRLGRIVDRARVVETNIARGFHTAHRQTLESETAELWHRIRLIYWAIRFCVSAALTVCLLIVTLFIGEFVTLNLAGLIAVLFVLAMLVLITGLVLFLFEVSISTQRIRQGLTVVLNEQSHEQGPT